MQRSGADLRDAVPVHRVSLHRSSLATSISRDACYRCLDHADPARFAQPPKDNAVVNLEITAASRPLINDYEISSISGRTPHWSSAYTSASSKRITPCAVRLHMRSREGARTEMVQGCITLFLLVCMTALSASAITDGESLQIFFLFFEALELAKLQTVLYVSFPVQSWV